MRPAANVAAVPDNPSNEYVMVCVNALDAAVTVNVPDVPIVNDGTVIVDTLGMVVRASVLSPIVIVPGRYDSEVDVERDAEHTIDSVPSLLCGTVIVPEHIVSVDTPPEGAGIESC